MELVTRRDMDDAKDLARFLISAWPDGLDDADMNEIAHHIAQHIADGRRMSTELRKRALYDKINECRLAYERMVEPYYKELAAIHAKEPVPQSVIHYLVEQSDAEKKRFMDILGGP